MSSFLGSMSMPNLSKSWAEEKETQFFCSQSWGNVAFWTASIQINTLSFSQMIIHQENIAYNHHLKHALGDFVKAHDDNDPKNTTASRLLDCLYHHPTSSIQEGHICLHLQTNHVILKHKVTPILVTHPLSVRYMHWHTLTARFPVLKTLIIPTKFYSNLLGLQEWITMQKSFKMKIMKWNQKEN